MIGQYDSLLQQVLALPTKERAIFAETVLDSLENEPCGIRASWIEEIESRMSAIKNGAAEFRDGDQVLADLKRKLS